MDVSIKVSLRGGHFWEFVCDEDDPMVYGLVSALPGASLDAALPPDGLIQIETRSGERMFLTRSSLVAVTIARAGAGARAPVQHPAIATSPFTLLPEFLDTDAVSALLALLAGHMPSVADMSQEIVLEALPEAVASRLVEALGRLPAAIAAARGQETHLNVSLRLVRGDAQAMKPADCDVLGFLLCLDGVNGVPAAGDAVVRASDGGMMPLASNCALIFGPQDAPLLTVRHGQVLLLSGSLRTGAADGSA